MDAAHHPPTDQQPGHAVTLRPLTPDDAERMMTWFMDPDVRADVGVRREPSLAYTEEWLASEADDDSRCARAIELDGEHVGNVVLDRIDRESGLARLSIYVGEETRRGVGVGRGALRLMLRLAFDVLALRKVYLTVHAENRRAIRAYESSGFVLEGCHRAEFELRGRWIDLLYFGVLREQFEPHD